jgi:hypothetical protein
MLSAGHVFGGKVELGLKAGVPDADLEVDGPDQRDARELPMFFRVVEWRHRRTE